MGGVKEPDGAQAVVQVEQLAQVDLRRHLSAVRPADVRQAHRSQKDGVVGLDRLDGAGRERVAAVEVLARADGELGEFEGDAVQFRLDRAQDLDPLRHHIGPDSVARQDCDPKLFHR